MLEKSTKVLDSMPKSKRSQGRERLTKKKYLVFIVNLTKKEAMIFRRRNRITTTDIVYFAKPPFACFSLPYLRLFCRPETLARITEN